MSFVPLQPRPVERVVRAAARRLSPTPTHVDVEHVDEQNDEAREDGQRRPQHAVHDLRAADDSEQAVAEVGGVVVAVVRRARVAVCLRERVDRLHIRERLTTALVIGTLQRHRHTG